MMMKIIIHLQSWMFQHKWQLSLWTQLQTTYQTRNPRLHQWVSHVVPNTRANVLRIFQRVGKRKYGKSIGRWSIRRRGHRSSTWWHSNLRKISLLALTVDAAGRFCTIYQTRAVLHNRCAKCFFWQHWATTPKMTGWLSRWWACQSPPNWFHQRIRGERKLQRANWTWIQFCNTLRPSIPKSTSTDKSIPHIASTSLVMSIFGFMHNDYKEKNKDASCGYETYRKAVKGRNISFVKLEEEECERCLV